jgi:hypothetical protein
MLYYDILNGSKTPTDFQISRGAQSETQTPTMYTFTPGNITAQFHEGTSVSSGSNSSLLHAKSSLPTTEIATRPPEEETDIVTLPQTPGNSIFTRFRIEHNGTLQDPVFIQVREEAENIYRLVLDRDRRRRMLSELVTDANRAASRQWESARQSGKLRPGSQRIHFSIHEGTGTAAEWADEPGHTKSYISPHCVSMENKPSESRLWNKVHWHLAKGTLVPQAIGGRVEQRVQGREERQRDYDIWKVDDKSLEISKTEQKDHVNFWELDKKNRAVLVRPRAADDDTVILL